MPPPEIGVAGGTGDGDGDGDAGPPSWLIVLGGLAPFPAEAAAEAVAVGTPAGPVGAVLPHAATTRASVTASDTAPARAPPRLGVRGGEATLCGLVFDRLRIFISSGCAFG
jgi:hypothetical protein